MSHFNIWFSDGEVHIEGETGKAVDQINEILEQADEDKELRYAISVGKVTVRKGYGGTKILSVGIGDTI